MTQDETQNPEVVRSAIYPLLFVRYVTYRLSKFPFFLIGDFLGTFHDFRRSKKSTFGMGKSSHTINVREALHALTVFKNFSFNPYFKL